MRLSAALTAVGLVSALSPQDQAPTKPPPIFRAGVDVVQLEVSVLDRDRRPVHGLTKLDLQVFEDGKQQDVIEVDEITFDDNTPPPVWARAVPSDVATNDLADRRLFAIIMDDLRCCAFAGGSGSDRWAIHNAIAAAEHLVDGLGPRDLATVALTHELIPMDRFTNDREVLHAAIKRFAPISEGGCRPLPPLPNMERDLVRLLALSPQPVKALIVIDPGGGSLGNIPWCPPRSYVIPDTGRRVYPTMLPDNGPEPDPLGLPPVPVYRLGVSGLSVGPIGSFANGPNLSGGRNYLATNDLGPAIEEVLAENGSYYLLGFRTSRPTTDGKYRRLDIKIPGHGDYFVRARTGYLRPKPPPKPGSRADRNAELPRPPMSVTNLLPSSDVTVQAAVAVFAVPGGKGDALILAVDLAHPVTKEAASASEEIDLRTVAYRAGDPKYDVHTKTTIDVPFGSNRVSKSMALRLDVTPEIYELWLTAHDARTNLVGGVFYDIEIPDFAAHAVSLSGVVIGAEPAAGVALPAALAGIVPIVPTTSRTFGQGQPVTAFFQIYQGRDTPLATVTLKIQVLDDQGKAAFASDESIGADRFSSHRAADYRLKLPLDALATGRYLLSIEARLGDRISPKRDVPFSVR